MYQSVAVAKKIVYRGRSDGEMFTPLQLLKLVYLAHAFSLALRRKPLIQESVEAWNYGPIIPELYRAIKHYRDKPVTEIDGEDIYDEDEMDIIEQVYSKYGRINGIRLSMLTNQKGSPWQSTWESGKVIISNDLITDYYQSIMG